MVDAGAGDADGRAFLQAAQVAGANQPFPESGNRGGIGQGARKLRHGEAAQSADTDRQRHGKMNGRCDRPVDRRHETIDIGSRLCSVIDVIGMLIHIERQDRSAASERLQFPGPPPRVQRVR
jgi:hypothetical protein